MDLTRPSLGLKNLIQVTSNPQCNHSSADTKEQHSFVNREFLCVTSIIRFESVASFTTFNRPSVVGAEIFNNQRIVLLERCYNSSEKPEKIVLFLDIIL